MKTSVYESKSAVEHAEVAAAAIRAINHLTFHDTALPYPADAFRLICELDTLAARLPQAFEQIAERLRRWAADGLIGIDAGTRYEGDLTRAVATANGSLTGDAVTAAAALCKALDVVRHALAYAHYTGQADDDVEASE